MRYATTSDQQKAFRLEGHVEVEDLFTPEELVPLREKLEGILTKDEPFWSGKSPSRKVEEVGKLARRKQLADILSQLSQKERLRLVYDHAIFTLPNDPLDLPNLVHEGGTLFGVLIDFNSVTTLFFSESFVPPLYNEEEPCYLLLVFAHTR